VKHLIPAPVNLTDSGFDPQTEYAQDVQRLVDAAQAQGYRLSPGSAAELWIRHSADFCASWLILAGASDAELVRSLLQHATVIDVPTSIVPPPQGYTTWLDYAVGTMDTRQPYLEQLLTESDLELTREAMRQAVQAELATLRKLAGLGK